MKKQLFPIFFSFVFYSCAVSYHPDSLQYNNYQLNNSLQQETSLVTLMKPYSDSLNKSMNDVIGFNESKLEKKMGENTLGYFMADAYLQMARIKYHTNVDAAFMNFGGIRLPDLAAGNITRGKIYELMPFDNLLLLVTVKGIVLKKYLDRQAAGDGPTVSGITMKIKNKRAYDIMVNGKPLSENSDYTITNSDYDTNNSEFLKDLPQKNIGYLQRDAIIDYVMNLKAQKRNISITGINRVNYAE